MKSIDDLADEDLANIFKRLPPYERLLVSEISKRCCGISRIPWRDVYYLDLSSIPRANIRVIVKQCPNLRTVFAKSKNFSWNQLHYLSRLENLSSVKLYQCLNVVDDPGVGSIPLLSSVFSGNLPNAPWKELVLSNFKTLVSAHAWKRYVIGDLPLSLERLQLNAVDLILPHHCFFAGFPNGYLFLNGLGRLCQLTCLILCTSAKFDYMRGGLLEGNRDPLEDLRPLTSLRELCIGGSAASVVGRLSLGLPRLEVLFVKNAVFLADDEELENLATKHPALRILCIAGLFSPECTIPVRRRYPNGFNADPVPKLHVFLSKKPSEKIIFTKSPADALEIHPITEPLPAFLEKEEIAPLFDGVWIAAQIKESAKNGSSWWKYEGDNAASFRTADYA